MHTAAVHMVRNLTAGMAMITCREPLLLSITSNLRSAFSSVLRVRDMNEVRRIIVIPLKFYFTLDVSRVYNVYYMYMYISTCSHVHIIQSKPSIVDTLKYGHLYNKDSQLWSYYYCV